MTAYDLLLLIATLCLVFLTGFTCAVLYYCVRILRIWNKLSQETEEKLQNCVDRFYDALHSFASIKNVVEIGLQTMKAVGTAYTVTRRAKQSRKNKSRETSRNHDAE